MGGGGLIAGIAMAMKKLNPKVKIIGSANKYTVVGLSSPDPTRSVNA